MEQITIDVTRTRGSRSARIRVHVAPRPGERGSSWPQGSALLPSDVTLDAELASHIAHSVEQAIQRYVARAEHPELPWD